MQNEIIFKDILGAWLADKSEKIDEYRSLLQLLKRWAIRSFYLLFVPVIYYMRLSMQLYVYNFSCFILHEIAEVDTTRALNLQLKTGKPYGILRVDLIARQ